MATRLDGMDRAFELANRAIERSPTDSDKSIEQLDALISSRLDGMDLAVKVLKETGSTIPHMVDEKVGSLEKVMSERFESIGSRFNERDLRMEQTSKGGESCR